MAAVWGRPYQASELSSAPTSSSRPETLAALRAPMICWPPFAERSKAATTVGLSGCLSSGR
eukprot:3415871-Lingulodinium_polyedra.AAC.1